MKPRKLFGFWSTTTKTPQPPKRPTHAPTAGAEYGARSLCAKPHYPDSGNFRPPGKAEQEDPGVPRRMGPAPRRNFNPIGKTGVSRFRGHCKSTGSTCNSAQQSQPPYTAAARQPPNTYLDLARTPPRAAPPPRQEPAGRSCPTISANPKTVLKGATGGGPK